MNDLNKIKKYYGENLMHLCRNLFPILLEQENLLFSLLESNFAHSKFLYEDIINNNLEETFKNYIYSLVDVEKEQIEVIKNPKELLEEAGYILYECHTESEIQKFKKYYSEGEELCTFNGGRLNKCYVFFAVKKNVNNIKREKFSNPQRQDEYGTSVISIQFSKGKTNTLSIKNRYNHRVNNPDATFGNNLENIISGLTRSFEKEYNLNINQTSNTNFNLTDYKYVKANDGKYYKYNYEINNIYYCPDNIIIDNFEVKKHNSEKYIIIDYFIIDLVNKKINLYDKNISDSFIDSLQQIKKIEINKLAETKRINITFNNGNTAYIEIDKLNRIISYKNEHIKTIKNEFLFWNKVLKEINIPNVIEIGNNFLCDNKNLHKINIQNVATIGNNFLCDNENLQQINIPKCKKIATSFMFNNEILDKINISNVTEIGSHFLSRNNALKEINIEKVIKINNNFLYSNQKLRKIDLPNTITIGNNFLFWNAVLKKINIPNVIEIGNNFLINNEELEEISLPKVQIIGEEFLGLNKKIAESITKKRTIKNNQ